MSKIALAPSASGTGTLTISAPDTSSDFTLSLPAATGTVLTSATTAGFPAGSVLQVVSSETNIETNIATTAFTDTGLSATITPSSSSNKIVVMWNIPAELFVTDSSERVATFQTLRASTEIDQTFMTMQNVTRTGQSVNAVLLDSPSTTSSVTYKVQAKVNATSASCSVSTQRYGFDSNIVLMEIAA